LIDGLLSFRQTVKQLQADIGLEGNVQLLYPEDEKGSLIDKLDLVESLLKIKEETARSGLFYLNQLF
jgi:hypothetical protein